MKGERFFVHDGRLHWQPIRWLNPTAEQVENLVEDGWQETDMAGYEARRANWKERQGLGCQSCDGPDSAA